MDPLEKLFTRRRFLELSSSGIGAAALATLSTVAAAIDFGTTPASLNLSYNLTDKYLIYTG